MTHRTSPEFAEISEYPDLKIEFPVLATSEWNTIRPQCEAFSMSPLIDRLAVLATTSLLTSDKEAGDRLLRTEIERALNNGELGEEWRELLSPPPT